jgi:hypothetical protein
LPENNLLARLSGENFEIGRDYTASFWMYNEGENFGQDAMNSRLYVEAKDEAGKIEWLAMMNPAQSIVINGSWSLVEINFTLKTKAKILSVFINGYEQWEKTIYIDDFLIREKSTDVYRIITEDHGQITELFKNNQQIKAADFSYKP